MSKIVKYNDSRVPKRVVTRAEALKTVDNIDVSDEYLLLSTMLENVLKLEHGISAGAYDRMLGNAFAKHFGVETSEAGWNAALAEEASEAEVYTIVFNQMFDAFGKDEVTIPSIPMDSLGNCEISSKKTFEEERE